MKSPARPAFCLAAVLRDRLELVVELERLARLGQPHSRQGWLTLW